MTGMLWRIIVAVVALALVWALIPPIVDVLGLAVSGSVIQIIRICAAGLAFFYVVSDSWPGKRV